MSPSSEQTTQHAQSAPEAPPEPRADAEAAPAPEPPEPAQETRSPNAEAARYRRQLRTTEAERDGLRTQLESLQRQQVAGMVSQPGLKLHDPEDLWRYGASLSDVLAEDGTVDAEKVRDLAKQLVKARPHLGSTAMPGWRDAMAGTGPSGSTPSWHDALRGGRTV